MLEVKKIVVINVSNIYVYLEAKSISNENFVPFVIFGR